MNFFTGTPANSFPAAIVVAVLFFQAQGAAAAEYSVERSLKFNTEYRDTDLGGVSASELTEFNLFPELVFQRETDSSEFATELNAHFRRYDEDNFDSDEYDAVLRYEREFERTEFFISAGAERSSTFIDRDDGFDGAQNVFDSQETDLHRLNASATFRLTERKSLTFNAGVANREYKKSDRFDSISTSAGVRFNNRFSERLSGVFLLNGNDFRSDDTGFFFNTGGFVNSNRAAFPGASDEVNDFIDAALLPVASGVCALQSFESFVDMNDIGQFVLGTTGSPVGPVPCYSGVSQENDSRVFGAQLGFNLFLTESFSINALGGASRVFTDRKVIYDIADNDDILIDRKNNTETWDLQFNYRMPRTYYNLNLNRQTYADSEGGIELRENVNFLVGFQFNEKTSTSLNLQWLKEESAFDEFSIEDRERWTISYSVSRSFAQNWTGTMRLRYYDENQKFRLDSEQYSLLFTIKWWAKPLVWSR